MTDDKKLSAQRAREIILKRRARFMAAALAGLSGLSCDDSAGNPTLCLSLADRDAQVPRDGGPKAGDSGVRDGGFRGYPDGGPRVCLSAPRVPDGGLRYPPLPADAGVKDAGSEGDAGLDAGPRVCLLVTILPDDDDEKST